MVRAALRRVLWLGPTLMILSALAFWAVSSHVSRANDHVLPRFFNPAPPDVSSLSISAVRRIASGGPEAEAASAELVSLGGAALPHVIPLLDTLDTAVRTRVAMALAPVAQRMDLARDRDPFDPRTTVLFWNRYWQDRSIDFRPVVVRRAVRRAIEHPSPHREAEVVAFDTYAVPDLIDLLDESLNARREATVRQIVRLLARVTSSDLAGDASSTSPWSSGERWRSWWAPNAHRFVVFQGTRRLVAMIAETQYGRVLTTLGREGLGVDAAGRPIGPQVRARARVTLTLLAASMIGGSVLGLLAACIARLGPGWIRRSPVLRSIAVTLPASAVAWGLQASGAGLPSAALAAAGLAAVTASLVASADLEERLSGRATTLRRAYGLSTARRVARAADRSIALLGSRVAADLPVQLTSVFVIERVFGLPGLGMFAVQALRDGALGTVLCLTVAATTMTAVALLLGALLLESLDPTLRGTTTRAGAR